MTTILLAITADLTRLTFAIPTGEIEHVELDDIAEGLDVIAWCVRRNVEMTDISGGLRKWMHWFEFQIDEENDFDLAIEFQALFL